MKNDHNLDDLIIDDIKPVRNRGKGILTIIALLIILFIVAIMMTRLFFDGSDQNATAVEQTQEELISPELKLDTSEHDTETEKKELDQLSSMMEETLSDEKVDSEKPSARTAQRAHAASTSAAASPKSRDSSRKSEEREPEKETVSIDERADERVDERVESARRSPAIESRERAAAPEKIERVVEKPAARAEKPAAPARRAAAVSGSWYIQVGSFTQKPSSRFLSVITRNGYRYTLRGGKLLIGPYSSDSSARRALPGVKNKINKGAFIKRL